MQYKMKEKMSDYLNINNYLCTSENVNYTLCNTEFRFMVNTLEKIQEKL
jgi:hypothetical protein